MSRYFWLKLSDRFFDSQEVRAIEGMENGGSYLVVWLKMLTRAIQADPVGRLRFRPEIPYNDKLLADVLHADIDILRSAMQIFVKLGMVSILEDKTIWIESAKELVGSETRWAAYKRLERAPKGQLDNVQAKSNSCPPETKSLRGIEDKSKNSLSPSAPASARKKPSAEENPPGFESFWKVYPRQKEKKAALAKWRATIKKGASEAELRSAAIAYGADCRLRGTEERFIKHPATFLGPAEPWRDFAQKKDSKPQTPDEIGAQLFGRAG